MLLQQVQCNECCECNISEYTNVNNCEGYTATRNTFKLEKLEIFLFVFKLEAEHKVEQFNCKIYWFVESGPMDCYRNSQLLLFTFCL